MPADFPRPVRVPGVLFEYLPGGEDPAVLSRIAHESAQALLSRVRTERDPEILERLLSYVQTHGIDAIAELWSGSLPDSLPGALWRIYLLHAIIRKDPDGVSGLYRLGVEQLRGIEEAVAGAAAPTGPDEIVQLADRILRGVFEGDFAIALERAAAFSRIAAAGAAHLADQADVRSPEESKEFTTTALRFSQYSEHLVAAARRWRVGGLD